MTDKTKFLVKNLHAEKGAAKRTAEIGSRILPLEDFIKLNWPEAKPYQIKYVDNTKALKGLRHLDNS